MNLNLNQKLLLEARPFCDSATGEVIERMPEDLMQRLREAKLARGIPGKPSERTESQATWYVFLTDEIRARVLDEWRTANAARKRGRSRPKKPEAASSAGSQSRTDSPGKSARPVKLSLREFRAQRKRQQ